MSNIVLGDSELAYKVFDELKILKGNKTYTKFFNDLLENSNNPIVKDTLNYEIMENNYDENYEEYEDETEDENNGDNVSFYENVTTSETNNNHINDIKTIIEETPTIEKEDEPEINEETINIDNEIKNNIELSNIDNDEIKYDEPIEEHIENEEDEESESEVIVTSDKTRDIIVLGIVAYAVYRLKEIPKGYKVADEVQKKEVFNRIIERLNRVFETLAIRSKLFKKVYDNMDNALMFMDVMTLITITEKEIELIKSEKKINSINPIELKTNKQSDKPKIQNIDKSVIDKSVW